MIIGSILIGLILGAGIGTGLVYFKDWKEKKYFKNNEDEILKKINKEKKKQKEVKNAREKQQYKIDRRTKQEHKSGKIAGTPSRKSKPKNEAYDGERTGVQVSNGSNPFRP